jgi:hypothetical protein
VLLRIRHTIDPHPIVAFGIIIEPVYEYQKGQIFNFVMDPLSFSASIVALLQLSSTVVKYLSDMKDAEGDRRNLMVEVVSIKGLLLTLQDLVQPGETWLDTVQSLGALNGPLELCELLLKRLEEKLSLATGPHKFRKVLAWPFQKGEIKDILCGIGRLKTLFGLALQNDHL